MGRIGLRGSGSGSRLSDWGKYQRRFLIEWLGEVRGRVYCMAACWLLPDACFGWLISSLCPHILSSL